MVSSKAEGNIPVEICKALGWKSVRNVHLSGLT